MMFEVTSEIIFAKKIYIHDMYYFTSYTFLLGLQVNTLRPLVPDDICRCIFLNENAWLSIKISLKFVPMGPINNIKSLAPIVAWRWSGDG